MTTEPNPEYVTAPFEQSGMSDLPMLMRAIEAAIKVHDPDRLVVTIITKGNIRPSMLYWNIKQADD